MRFFVIISISLLLAQGCKWFQESEFKAPVELEREIKLIENFEGDYYGILPYTTGAGIRTTLILKKDSTYTLNMDYVDIKSKGVSEQGRFTLSNNIITISYKTGNNRYFLLEDDKVHSLDKNKNRVEGIYSVYYTLIKQ
ncbi:MAG: copper resistance protein NlpE [Bacteroidales bacterium]|nr:copper resistance protein NlpE [Bacteroidales bacterium]